jgi:pimeloyl-ACP methyl ester carboxylesterase
MAADVVRLFSHLDVALPHATRYLLGISMGGMIAQLAAAQMIGNHQQQQSQMQSHHQKHIGLDRLFLVSTTAGGPHRTRADDAPSQGTVHELLNVQDYPSHLQRMQRYFGTKFKSSSPLLIETMAKNVFKNASADSEKHRATAQWEASKNFDGAKALESIKAAGVPVSVISGDEDLIMPLANAIALNALLSPVGELVVYPGTGHLLLIEEPEAFASTISASIQKN